MPDSYPDPRPASLQTLMSDLGAAKPNTAITGSMVAPGAVGLSPSQQAARTILQSGAPEPK